MAQTTFSSLDEYLQAREQLIQTERDESFYAGATETPLEAKAGQAIEKLREWESQYLHVAYPDGTGTEAGHKYLNGLQEIEESKLLAIAFKAPKGALLHVHFDAILPPDTILEDARKQENLYVQSNVPLVSSSFYDGALPQFEVFSKQKQASLKSDDTTNIFSKTYSAGSWMPYSEFLKRFPRGLDGAERWLRKKMLLSADEAYHGEQTVNGIWKCFNRSVMVARSLLKYETAYREHFRRILWKFAEDGIFYAEIRLAQDYGFTITSDDGTTELGTRQMLKMLQTVLQEELPRIKEKGHQFLGVKFIYACMRSANKTAMTWCMDNAIEMKQLFPDLICAFDMHGQEDVGFPLKHWLPEILAMRKKTEELGLDLPFNFHAGETHDHTGDTDSNLYDAILLGTKRIGHGFSLTKHPHLMKLCKERGIAIETCPISNEILGLCGNAKTHHLPVLLANSVPATINSDDPGSWRASVMSHDFYRALVGSNMMSLLGWRILAEWSIKYSYMSEDMQTQAQETLKSSWKEFCQWIVDNYE